MIRARKIFENLMTGNDVFINPENFEPFDKNSNEFKEYYNNAKNNIENRRNKIENMKRELNV